MCHRKKLRSSSFSSFTHFCAYLALQPCTVNEEEGAREQPFPLEVFISAISRYKKLSILLISEVSRHWVSFFNFDQNNDTSS
ncbi:uncharacterized protein CLUP02_02009 [Colletotrichum lupini]|uniref:Uncharacterized protein n=1 Tax=Colletotrichum lupini TaxID=145971 RepID=A0A9Q8SE70_9PEZI|nr:uncharacterized protein CLUP02_02009 [Colletotrichum lupini]UQC75355.1 hypothetical protein CLUP02_02009 [Colletotrichum lupini]